MKVLLLSAYDAQSHARWRVELCSNLPDYQWTVLSLPPRHFAWRFRGNALAWRYHFSEQLAQRYDVVLATSMVDLAGLKALHPTLAAARSILYFHENQFAFPQTAGAFTPVDIQLSSLYSALAADKLVFNSHWNQNSFIDGVQNLLAKFPDYVPDNIHRELQHKSTVLPVPLADSCFGERPAVTNHAAAKQSRTLEIVWNHRWEFDKGPERLLLFAQALLARQLPFTLHIVGQQFRQQPAEFAQIKTLLQGEHSAALNGRLGEYGFLQSKKHYLQLLSRADIVLSTALQDFQGLAVMEAVAMGCIPLLPARLAYPDFFPDECLYRSYPEDAATEAQAAVDRLIEINSATVTTDCASSLQNLRWQVLGEQYRQVLLGD